MGCIYWILGTYLWDFRWSQSCVKVGHLLWWAPKLINKMPWCCLWPFLLSKSQPVSLLYAVVSQITQKNNSYVHVYFYVEIQLQNELKAFHSCVCNQHTYSNKLDSMVLLTRIMFEVEVINILFIFITKTLDECLVGVARIVLKNCIFFFSMRYSLP